MKNDGKKAARSKCLVFRLVLVAIFLITVSGSLKAQVTASLSGRVEDSSGAAVAGATVTATSVESGIVRTATTGESGNYQLLSLPVGQYEVKVEKSDFETQLRRGINLAVGQDAVVNFALKVGNLSQSVTVTAEAPIVNTTTSSVSGLVNEQQVKELPLNGRSFDTLITLNAGAVMSTANTSNPAQGSGSSNSFEVDGRFPQSNFFLLNGVQYTGNSQGNVNPGGASGQLLGVDAVREFNVVSNTYGAEYGFRAGSQVSIVTQSGTNQLHGSVFEFLRNSALDARNYFDEGPIPGFKRNQFGAAVGGPIEKDKTFFFTNYEGFRQRLGLSDLSFVPDMAARQGSLPNSAGVETPVAGLNPAMLNYMAYWPVPNGPDLGAGIAESFSHPLQKIREDFGTLRIDHTFSSTDSVSGIYTIDDGYNLTPMQNPNFANQIELRQQVLSLQESHIFSAGAINTFRVGFSRGGFGYTGVTLSSSFPSGLALVQGQNPGVVTIGGSTGTQASTITPGGSIATWTDARNVFTYEDDVQIAKGKHQLSIGFAILPIQSTEKENTRANGNASFSTLTTFLQGTVSSFLAGPVAVPLYWRTLEGAWYVEDSIQLRKNLSLRIGLRHEFTNGWNEAHGHASNYALSNGVLVTDPVIGDSIFSQNNAKWLFGPRVGIAWDVFGNGRTSLRAGFGTHYDLQDNLGFEFEAVEPFNPVVTFANVPILPLLPVGPSAVLPPCSTGVPSSQCAIYLPQGVQRDMKTPTVEAYELAIQQELSQNMSLSVSYTGSNEYHAIIPVDLNAIHPEVCASSTGCVSGGISSTDGIVQEGASYIPVGTRPNPFLANGTFWMSEGTSSYNALQVQVDKRISQGLRFRASYTFAKSFDISDSLASTSAMNEASIVMEPYNPRADWGLSGQNITHQGRGNFSYDLPFGRGRTWLSGVNGISDKLISGWEADGIVTWQSGFPFSPLVGSSRSGDGDSKNPDRPNYNPNFSGPIIEGSPNQWFNPNAFSLPTPGTYGNVGRDSLIGPGLAELDFSLIKETSISERIKADFRTEFFNIFNHSNFLYPNLNVFSGGQISPTAGIITGTSTTSRQIQFGLKLIF